MESLTASSFRSSSTGGDAFSLGRSGTDLGAIYIQCTDLVTCTRSRARYNEAIDHDGRRRL